MGQMVRVSGTIISREKLNSPEGQTILKAAHSDSARVFCMCSSDAPEMYITHRSSGYFIARTPGSGQVHHPACQSFDIDDDSNVSDNGRTVLHPGFPLHHAITTDKGPSVGTSSHSSAVTPNTALNDLLYTLWWKADFHRWYPRMNGKRSWHVVNKHVLEAAGTISLGRRLMEDVLFLPTFFDRDHAIEHQKTNVERLESICSSNSHVRSYGLVLGMAKQPKASKFGYQVQLKHLPEVIFYLRQNLFSHAQNSYPFQFLGLQDECNGDVVALLLVERTEQGYFNVIDAAFMRTTKELIPVLNIFEEELINKLVLENRSFVRNLPIPYDGEKPVAYLTDTGSVATKLSISYLHLKPIIPDVDWHWNPSFQVLSLATKFPPIQL